MVGGSAPRCRSCLRLDSWSLLYSPSLQLLSKAVHSPLVSFYPGIPWGAGAEAAFSLAAEAPLLGSDWLRRSGKLGGQFWQVQGRNASQEPDFSYWKCRLSHKRSCLFLESNLYIYFKYCQILIKRYCTKKSVYWVWIDKLLSLGMTTAPFKESN